MKRINVPLHLQAPGSIDCGPACNQMLLDHFLGLKVSLDELKAHMDYVEAGTTLYQNGSVLLKYGLKVTAITANPLVFPGNVWAELDSDEKVKAYVSKKAQEGGLSDTTKLVYRTLLQFLDDGGHMRVKIPDFDDIKRAIDAESIVSAVGYMQPLGENEGKFHFVLVTGYDDNNVFLNNSWPDSTKQGWFPIDRFLFAVHSSAAADADNGGFLVVSKR